MTVTRRPPGRLAAALWTLAALAAVAALWSCSPAHAREYPQGASAATGVAAADSRADASVAPDPTSFWNLSGTDPDAALEALFAAMSPEERLGQLFMMSYSGDEPTGLILTWIRRRGLGSVKIFGWNADDTVRLAAAVRAMQEAAVGGPRGLPPFMATDQEGGWIRHVKGGTSVTPGNMAIGASAWPSDAYASARYIGLELSALGITMNFAPTVDLATKPDSSIIGPRAFSNDPRATAVLAAAWARGMEDAGVLPTAKHFPGHGDTNLDSHGILPVLDADEDTLWNRELVPYRLLAAEGIPGVMSGHLAFPAVTGNDEPASLSPRIVTGILRERIGYDGLVITDDLLMAGAWSPGGLSEAGEKAIRAGNDILMFSRTLALDEPAWTRLMGLYRSDEAFRARIDQSCRRVLRAKLRWLLPRGRDGMLPAPDPEAAMRTAESREFFQAQALRSATLVGDPDDLPTADGPGLLLAGQFGDFFAAGSRRFPSARSFRFAYLPGDEASDDELESFRRALARAESVVVCVANPAGAEFARAAAASGKPFYVVSVLNPSFALEFSGAAPVVAVYSYSAESFRAAFAVLAGDVEAPGRLPVELAAP